MEYGIVNLSAIPARKEPSDRSEMVNQLLFGESVTVLEKLGPWRRIRSVHDNYEAWVDHKQFLPISNEVFKNTSAKPSMVTTDLAQILVKENALMTIMLGSTLPAFNDSVCHIDEAIYTYPGQVRDTSVVSAKGLLVENAYMYLNAPYLWGGRSPFGIDCSGLTQMVYKLNGVSLKRDASQQAEQGNTLHLLDETEPGDLAFFDNENGDIIHVGIILKDQEIIHASGCVRIDKIDHHGIYNKAQGKYTHNLRTLKRII